MNKNGPTPDKEGVCASPGCPFSCSALRLCRQPARLPQRSRRCVVFAATSLTDVLQDLSEAYTRKTEQTVTFSFAGSSALAHQLEAGEAADVFLPADSESMDFAEKRHLIDPATRVDLLRNRLVLIAPAADATTLKILPASIWEERWRRPAGDSGSSGRGGRPIRALCTHLARRLEFRERSSADVR